MRRTLVYLIILGLLALPGVISARGVDFYSLFPNLVLGSDPNGTDSVYTDCGGITANQVTLQVRVKTDNADPNDALQGIYIPIELSADQAGVTLDSTVTSAYTGSAVQNWQTDGAMYVSVVSNGGDPSGFPMQLVLDGVDLDQSDVLGAGDHLVASLKFNVSQPTNICATGTFEFQSNGIALVTTEANGYTPAFTGGCCGPIVPSLSEWGLILFGITLLLGLVWYVRKRRVAARV
ncbi:MAG: hypothetical protein A2Z27_03895 [candidate division Zixibacteria bacterium RBG_16_50_21]|nr:MAG: hypothetical protein A2Z27_03895 [candidate division Zixibacteria bacterium RBG_16_50_21]